MLQQNVLHFQWIVGFPDVSISLVMFSFIENVDDVHHCSILHWNWGQQTSEKGVGFSTCAAEKYSPQPVCVLVSNEENICLFYIILDRLCLIIW